MKIRLSFILGTGSVAYYARPCEEWTFYKIDPAIVRVAGRLASQWVVLARSEADLGALGLDTRWEELRSEPNTPLWTDDFSNLLSAFKW